METVYILALALLFDGEVRIEPLVTTPLAIEKCIALSERAELFFREELDVDGYTVYCVPVHKRGLPL